jgi:hypothetical protein
LTPVEVVALLLGSAVIAAAISGLFARATTNSLIGDQRLERHEVAEREERRAAEATIAAETDQFLQRYVGGGLEMVASQLDRASHQVDINHRRSKRLRAMTRNLPDQEPQATFRDLVELRGILDPPQADPIHINQSSLVPFPGDFMQAGLLLNRCIALADDFLQRYAWTKDEKLGVVEKYLTRIKTVLAASARHYEAAAVVVRQMPPRRYQEWSAAALTDERLIKLSKQVTEMVDELLSREPDLDKAPSDVGIDPIPPAAVRHQPPATK